jgi:hypothetical protein
LQRHSIASSSSTSSRTPSRFCHPRAAGAAARLAEDPDAPLELGARYQYLANGWWTWNPDGTFASLYVQDSWAHKELPVLSYDVVLQSGPSLGDEATTAQANATAPASSFAKQWISLRNQLAPNVLLAYHMSGWGTRHDIVYEDPPDATVRAYATQSAAFYNGLHAHFDLAFEDFSDRDAGFYEQQGNAKTWFTPGDFDGRLADPARQHVPGRHVGPLSRQQGRMAPRQPAASAGVRQGRLRRLPLRRRRRRHDLGADRRRLLLQARPRNFAHTAAAVIIG